MWRFAVYTQKTSILSKTCMKTLRQALKHTDGRTEYSRFLSNDAASTIRIDKDTQVRDVFSIDDFGLLSVNRSQSIESMSSAGSEHTFLEQLFRNDTLNTFSNVQIPTTISSRELGGSSDVFGYDYVSELLSEGAIPEELAEDLAQSASEIPFEAVSDSASYHDDQEPSTSGLEVTSLPFLIPSVDETTEKNVTRKVLSEKVRRERKLNLSTTSPPETAENSSYHLFHASETSTVQNVGEMLFPETIPTESYTSKWKEGESPVELAQNAPETPQTSQLESEFSLEVIEGIITEGTMTELQEELKAVGFWPEWLFTGNRGFIARTNKILRFAVENCEDHRGAEEFLKKFASSHLMAVVPDDVLLHLTNKSVSSSLDFASAVQQFENSTSFSTTRELRPIRSLVETQLTALYSTIIQKFPENSPAILALCLKMNFERTAETFMKCYGESQANSENFLKSFAEWKKLSVKYGTQQGIDSYWMAALQSEDKGLSKRIEMILLHSGKSEHPFTTMARMICALVKLDRLEKAVEVFRTVSVSGKHFGEPLATFVEKKDLESVERLAALVERGMLAEKRRGKRAVNKMDDKSEKSTLLSEDVHAVLAKFYGVGGQKQKKFTNKNLKKKIHRVDEEQLHGLCKSIQKAWIQCATDKESLNRLVSWCQTNRLEIDEKMQKLIDSSYSS